MKKPIYIFLLTLFSIVSGCVASQPVIQKSQLQTRAFQTRSYESADTTMVMKAVMHTLQDDGYIVKQVNVDLGLLTAQKELDVADEVEELVVTLLAGPQARYQKNAIIEASANVSDFGANTRVRINFQKKVMDNAGGVVTVKQEDDLKFYQEFFTKVDKAIFIAEEKI